MYRIERARDWLDAHRDFVFDAVRVYLGVALFLKGATFVGQMSRLVELTGANVPWSSAWLAHYVAAAHLVGGVMLAIGAVTRLAAAVQIPPVLGAVLFVHRREGLFTPAGTLELALLVLVLLGVFVLVGAGRLSVDAYAGGIEWRRRHPA